jgi:hypothetical protein
MVVPPTYVIFNLQGGKRVAINPALVTMITENQREVVAISFSNGGGVLIPKPLEKVIAALRGAAIS